MNKIASAIYLVTSFFNDQEPLKWRLRDAAGDLVAPSVKDKMTVSEEIVSLLTLARQAQIISVENADILIREVRKVGEEAKIPLIEALNRRETPPPAELPAPVRETILKDNLPAPARSAPLREFGAVSVKKNARQSAIINLLKRKKEAIIKDITPLIPHTSEKTVQRELAAMVEAGILKKMGEKRWTRYSLV